MKEKIKEFRKNAFGLLATALFFVLYSIFFTKHEESYIKFIAYLLIGGGIIIYQMYRLYRGYPAKRRDEIKTGTKIKVISLFSSKSKKGISEYLYEVQFENGEFELITEEEPYFKVNNKYSMTNQKDWMIIFPS